MARWLGQSDRKTNEAVGTNNCLTMTGGKRRLVRTFRRKELWKCIGCVILEFIYWKKGHKIWSEIPICFGIKAPTKLQKDVCRNTNLYKVCCYIYHTFYIYACNRIVLYYTTSFIYWMFILVLNYTYTDRFTVYPWQGLRGSGRFGHVPSLLRRLNVPLTSGKWFVSLMGLKNCADI